MPSICSALREFLLPTPSPPKKLDQVCCVHGSTHATTGRAPGFECLALLFFVALSLLSMMVSIMVDVVGEVGCVFVVVVVAVVVVSEDMCLFDV
jgi:hypothetical protein